MRQMLDRLPDHATGLARCALVVAIALVALLATMGIASPALAIEKACHLHVYGTACETEKEHAEFQAFANCPFGASAELDCSWAQSTYKEQWPSKKAKEEFEAERGRKPAELPSEFKAGNITVLLTQAIMLRGGIGFEEEKETWFGPDGVETIQPVPQVAQPLTKDVNTALLSQTELNRYNYYVKVSKETKATATVELAGPSSAIQVSVNNLLKEEGTAFAFPVKIKLSNPFFGNDCYVGSNSSPIVVAFTTGKSGELAGKSGSKLKQDRNGFLITVDTDTLVNSTFASPGVEGCGVGGGADDAINSALGLPSPEGHNLTVLNGTLKLSTAENAKEGLEGKI
jgi:hypothetical protein